MSVSPAADVYALGLERPLGARCLVRARGGGCAELPLGRWLGPPQPEEERLLARARGPVLDIGCGPARHVLALTRRGVPTLGLDVSAEAVRVARASGARVIHGSVFDAVPRAGSWRTALLLDGSIGIGGDPVALLRRAAGLLRRDGRIFVELSAPGMGSASVRVRLEAAGEVSEWFDWAQVGVDDVHRVAAAARLEPTRAWDAEDRWFAELVRAPRPRRPASASRTLPEARAA